MNKRIIFLGGILLASAMPVLALGAEATIAPQRSPAAIQTAHGIGVIEAINTRNGTFVIKHQPIASIGWPAMTMKLTADPSGLLRSIRVGERVRFTLRIDGMTSMVTALSPAK